MGSPPSARRRAWTYVRSASTRNFGRREPYAEVYPLHPRPHSGELPSRMPTLLDRPHAYWRATKAHRYSLIFALPLLVLYEVLAATLGGAHGVRNGADALLKGAFAAVFGPNGPLVFAALLILGCVYLIWRDRHGGQLRAGYFGLMFVESVVLALLFGLAVSAVTVRLLHPLGVLALAQVDQMGWWTRLMMSLGAGLYEELLFRVILVAGLAWLGRRALGLRPVPAGVLATVLGALLFSLAHYVGPYGDPLALPSFTFRFVAGLFFSGLYLLRGFGITAWTHALYDAFLLLL